MKGSPNFGMAIAALVMSVSFWLYVQGQEARKTTEILSLPLDTIVNDSTSDYPYVAVRPPTEVKVKLEGTPEELERFNNLYNLRKVELQGVYKQEKRTNQTVLRAQVDLTKLSLDQTTVRPAPFRNKDLGNIKAEYLDELPITVEELDSRPVRVAVSIVNQPEGMVFTSMNVDPPTIMVRGAKSLVQSVKSLAADLNLDKYVPGQTYTLSVRPKKEDGGTVQEVTLASAVVRVTPVMAEAPSQRTVSVDVRFSATDRLPLGYRLRGWQVEPLSVTAMGSGAENLANIATEPISVKNLKEGSNSIRNVKLIRPKGIEKLSQTTCRVIVVIEKIPPMESPVPAPSNTTGSTTGTPPNQ